MKRRDFLAAAAGSVAGSAAVSAKGVDRPFNFADPAVKTAGLTNAEIGRAFRIAKRYRGTYLAWRAGRIMLVSKWRGLSVLPIDTLDARLRAENSPAPQPTIPQWNLTDAELGWAWVVAKRPQRIGAGWSAVLYSSDTGEAYATLMPVAMGWRAFAQEVVPVKPVSTFHERLADAQLRLQDTVFGGDTA